MDIQEITPEPLLAHYLSLSENSQRTRFFTQPSATYLSQRVTACMDATLLASVEDDDITGVCEIHPLTPTHVELALSVCDSHQGEGLGKTLLDAGLKRAKNSGATTATLHFARSNTRMHALLSKHTNALTLEDDSWTAVLPL